MVTTRIASELSGLSYGQIKYWTREGVLSRPDTVDRRNSYAWSMYDLTLLRLAGMLKNDGYNLKAIKQAVSLVENNWKEIDNPDQAGVLMVTPDGRFGWLLETDLKLTVGDVSQSISGFTHLPNFFYNVRVIAYDVFSKVET